MKKAILLSAVVILFFGCKASKTIEFCEGISTEGEGVKCGDSFSAGELTMIIKPESPFILNKIILNIYKKGKYRTDKFGTLTVDVRPESATVKTNFYFYDEGDFMVEAIGQDNKKIAEGKINIVELY